jgi:transcriptional regulator with XRE-family HTH domain
MNALWNFVRERASAEKISLTELARKAGKSRQTLYALAEGDTHLPELQTLVDVALVLGVHPLQLIHLVFEDYRLPTKQSREHNERGDRSVFRADITIPDGTVVMAGSMFTKVWEVQNLGTLAWENRFLACVDDNIEVRTSRSGKPLRVTEKLTPTITKIPVPYTAPGGIVRLAVDFRAPSLPCTVMSYWKSTFEDGTMCLPNSVGLSCVVRVISMRSEDRLDGHDFA